MGSKAQAGVDDQLVLLIQACLCETFFFGMYTTVFVFGVSILSKRGSTPIRLIMLAVSVAMYTVAAAHWAMNMAIASNCLRVDTIIVSSLEMLVVVYLPTINYILSDGIVVWRAWVLWGPSRRFTAFFPPLLFLSCTLTLSAAGAAFVYVATEYESERDENVSRYLGWTIWGLSIGTNLWATGLISIRTWQHRRTVRSLLGKETAKYTAEKILIFMVESGALYLCIWAVYMVTSFVHWGGIIFLDTAIVQVVGIYPMAIILFVAARLSTASILSLSDFEAFEPNLEP